MTYETYLRIVIEERLQFLTQFLGRDGVVVQILKPHVQQFKQLVTIQSCPLGQLVHLVVFQTADDNCRNVEVVLILHITIAQQSATHQCINIAGITEHTYFI